MTYDESVRRGVFGLLADGLSVREVAARAGVSVSVVRLWRSQVGGVVRHVVGSSERYLDRDERYEIARLSEAGCSGREIARRLGRAPSTISRELRRNITPGRRGGPSRYQPERAQQLAARRRSRPRPSKLTRCSRLRAWVQYRLDERDSPEQIAGRLPVEFSDDEAMRISHETIYRALYLRPRGELTRQLRAHLRSGRTHRRPRSARTPRGQILDAVSIHDRPEEIEGRLVPGHYEGDLIVGMKGSAAAIGTLVERTSGHLTLVHLPLDHTAATTAAALTAVVNELTSPFRSLTWDRGHEMSHHTQFTEHTGITVYFADPYAPWQRGSNENVNGLLREYFPKGTDLADYTATQIKAAQDQLNDRPRKRLGFRTPNEVMADIMATTT